MGRNVKRRLPAKSKSGYTEQVTPIASAIPTPRDMKNTVRDVVCNVISPFRAVPSDVCKASDLEEIVRGYFESLVWSIQATDKVNFKLPMVSDDSAQLDIPGCDTTRCKLLTVRLEPNLEVIELLHTEH